MVSFLKRLAILMSLGLIAPLATVLASSTSAQAAYRPPPGVLINNPLGSNAAKFAINDHFLRAVGHTTKGQSIRVVSWNIRKRSVVRTLAAAHERGVTVKVLMAEGNHNKRDYNRDFVYLRNHLSKGNANRGPGKRSWARLCVGSCVSAGGIMHAKWFLFSKTGTSSNVVMHGSANLTEAAIRNQWNDLHTMSNKRAYDFMVNAFGRMSVDRNISDPMRAIRLLTTRLFVFPWEGPGTSGDPILRALAPVRCTNAGAAGINGRTVIRIAQTVISGDRGLRIATRLARLSRNGCNVRIVYTLLGKDVKERVQAAGVRVRQLTRDRDGDGAYDDYMHLKAMTIGGNYDGVKNRRNAWNGSHNWTSKSLTSDETFVRIEADSFFRVYSRWVDKYMTAYVPGARMANARGAEAPNAYKNVEFN